MKARATVPPRTLPTRCKGSSLRPEPELLVGSPAWMPESSLAMTTGKDDAGSIRHVIALLVRATLCAPDIRPAL
jgi:hypothetical protein